MKGEAKLRQVTRLTNFVSLHYYTTPEAELLVNMDWVLYAEQFNGGGTVLYLEDPRSGRFQIKVKESLDELFRSPVAAMRLDDRGPRT